MQTLIAHTRKLLTMFSYGEASPSNPVYRRWIQRVARNLIVCGLLVLWSPSLFGVTFRWASSSYRIYVTGPGSATLSDIKAALPKVPLTQIAPAVWHLRAELQVENGAKLLLHGTKIGGDVNQLRLQSNNTSDPHSIVFITADWGTLDIRSTAITSWDDAVQGPDTEYSTFERAYIRVRSTLDANGVTPLESRMDVVDSDIGYLGSHNAEAYGLVWKVNPPKTAANYGRLTNLYNLVNVYGDILRSRIHNNYFGVYTFGAYGMRMLDNEVDHNEWYGFDPHDDSDSLVIENNNVHHNAAHGIIASQRCNNLVIRNNTSWNNGGNGIMLHRYCDDSLIENNRCYHNGDSGVALFDNNRTTVRGNTCWYNFLSGIRCSVGAADNLIVDNEFAYGANYGFYLFRGIDAPKPGDNGHPKRNQFVNNLVHNNGGTAIYLETSDDNLFAGNTFAANIGPFWFINGQRNSLDSNSIPSDVTVRTQGNPSVLATTFVRNQPFLTFQVDAYSSTSFSDLGGRIFDPVQPGIATTVTPGGSALTLTAADILKTSTVVTRNFQALPDAGFALIAPIMWNVSGDFSKSWQGQASAATHSISYRIGDMGPNVSYTLLRNGVAIKVTSDAAGYVTYQDKAAMAGVMSYVLRP